MAESLRNRLEERARRARSQAQHSDTHIRPAAPGTRAPATVAQQGLWVANELSGNVAFTVPVLHDVEGPLDVGVLDRAMAALVERHVAFRTTFTDADGDLTQVLRSAPASVLTVRSLAESKPELREVQAESIIAAEIATTFDLTEDIPFRATLISLGPTRHKLLLTIHHIACDQWSMGIFASELATAYAALLRGEEPRLRPIEVDYLQLGDVEAGQGDGDGIAHFVSRAQGKAALRFVPDKQRPAQSSFGGDERALWLGGERTRAIQDCARSLSASPFIVTLAAFLALARVHGGEDEFVFGTSAAGRDSEDLAGLIGFFVNTLVLHAEAPAEMSFAALVEQVKGTVSQAQERANTPFGEVVTRLGVSGDGTGKALTAVLFQQDNTPGSTFAFEGCTTTLDDNVNSHAAKYELLVSVRNQAHDTRVHVQYDTDLFTPSRVEALLSAIDHCLQAACEDPSRPIGELPTVSPAEAQTLAAINATEKEFTGAETLHGLVLAQAELRPDAEALLLPGGTAVTYKELATDATAVAARLVKEGAGITKTVLVALPPGREYLVACLATSMTGAAFVPVAHDMATERLAQIRAAAQPVAEFTSTEVVESWVYQGAGAGFEPRDVEPDAHAYIIFTSGSTGVPKGVQIRHRGIVNNLNDLAGRLNLTSADRCLAISSTGFDMSIFEGFGILSVGGASVILDPEFRRDPSHWLERAVDERATVWNSAPALLGAFLDELEQDASQEPPPLRAAVLGGDWAPLSMPARWWAFFGDATFDVLGGATEASIHSTYTRVAEVDPTWNAVPYGRPMANQKSIVVDEQGRLCPIGVPGRLLLGGVGLASGYLGAEDLTREKFQAREDGEVWYDTGDIARWNNELTLELLGRRDFLIKLAGLRIEPGDVEAAIVKSGQVTSAVVFPVADPDERLVAVLESEQHPDMQTIRQKLVAELPSYMIPSEFRRLTAMPLNTSGKLDRKQVQLLFDTAEKLTGSAKQVPLDTEREAHVAQVWTEVLSTPVESAVDDFFALGGDSFKAVKAARLIDPNLPTVALFRYPTVRELANYLDTDGSTSHLKRLVRLSGADTTAKVRLVCVPYGGGNAIAYQPLADQLGDAVEVLSVNLPGHDLADGSPMLPISQVADQVAAELRQLPEMPTAVYAQCAGCATADRLARAMRRDGIRLDAVFVGAALPDRDPQASMALVRDGDDALLLGHMRGLGGFDGVLDNSDITRILKVVRHDLQEMVRMYLTDLEHPPVPLDVPVHCVVGGADPATEGFQDRYGDWGRLGSPVSLSVLPTGDHYFCTTDPAGLATHIRTRLGLTSSTTSAI